MHVTAQIRRFAVGAMAATLLMATPVAAQTTGEKLLITASR